MWCVATYPYGLWYQFGDVSVHVRHALENRSNYGIFLGLAHSLRDVDMAEKMHQRAVMNASGCASALGRYAEFLETERSDVVGAGKLFERCHEADALNLLGLLGLAAMKDRSGDSDAGERLYRQVGYARERSRGRNRQVGRLRALMPMCLGRLWKRIPKTPMHWGRWVHSSSM